jgi:hypothetical protein
MLCLCACGDTGSQATEGTDAVGGMTTQPESTGEEATEATTQPETDNTTEPSATEETAPAFSPENLSVWGIPEPSFDYEFVGYSEAVNGPDMVGRFYYTASTDFLSAQAYVQWFVESGWSDNLPDPNDPCPFGFVGSMNDYKILVRWNSDNSVIIAVTDKSVEAVWDDEVNTYVIPAYGPYGSYGEYNADLMYQ